MPDEELTPEDCCRPLLEVDELAPDDVPVDDVLDCAVPDDAAVDAWSPDEVDVPGFVSALAAPNSATAAIEARPAPTVSRFRRRSAASRAAARRRVAVMDSMVVRLGPGPKPSLRAG